MEVKVIKFERHLDAQKVSVTFSIKKLDTGFATNLGALVDMQGTDDDIVNKALEIIQPDIVYWLSTEKNVIGKTFTIDLPQVPVTDNVQTVEVPTENLVSTDQTNS